MRETYTVLQWEDTRGMQLGINLLIRVMDTVLQWEDTREMQVDIDIGNETGIVLQ